MNIRFFLALWAGKLTGMVLHQVGSGGAALPGLISSRIDPAILKKLAKRGPSSIIFICGTNGKTTTSRMLAAMYPHQELIHNRSGSNLLRGHITAYLEKTSWLGSIKATTAILEVDEAVLPHLLHHITPQYILLHNLFRDQLDRYGEVDSIAKKWQAALLSLSTTTFFINADDPHLAFLGTTLQAPVFYYGVDDTAIGTSTPASAVDTFLSPSDQTPLSYTTYYLSHLGHYQAKDGFSRPQLDFAARKIQLAPVSSSFSLQRQKTTLSLKLHLPGLYNVYNALAAASLAHALTIKPTTIQTALKDLSGAFGRFETIHYQGRPYILCLIKNPAGSAEVLRTIALDKQPYNLAFLMHDNFADGLDVSWYWDTPYELCAQQPQRLLCSGKRAADIALRLKYAGYTAPLTCYSSFQEVLNQAVSAKTYILTTYTASLELQTLLQKQGVKPAYWKE